MVVFATLAALLLHLTGWAQTAPVPIRKLDSLATVETPGVPGLNKYIKNRPAAIALGKALFWDMNVGSDGKQACATCHFDAGADSRAKNQVSPGLKAGDTTFQLGGPNYQLLATDFPIGKAINDVISSQGVHATNFTGVTPGFPSPAIDQFTVPGDPTFSIGGIETRKVEPRNTPTTVNAVFNFRNFWDGRAQNDCNFLNPFGKRDNDPAHHLYKVTSSTTLAAVKPTLPNSSLCSQALGPPLSLFEMSADHRSFQNLGKKLVGHAPLSQQAVDPLDGVLGTFSNSPFKGLKATYLAMIQNAFQPQWWQSSLHICIDSSGNESTVNSSLGQSCPLNTTEYTLAEYNFSLFWGLSVQMYESTLRADRSRLDKFFEAAALTAANTTIATGDGIAVNFNATLTPPVLLNSVSITAGAAVGKDDGKGNIISDTNDVVGTINYSTGALSLTFTIAPALGVLVNVGFENVPTGILTAQELQGLDVFANKGKCAACHNGPEMTNASVANVSNEPLERMFFPPSGLIKVYDNGFYNTGVRQTQEDIALGDNDPFGNPLSMTELLRQKVCANPSLVINVPPRPGENIPGAPLSCSDLVNRDGSFKASTIRNVELTAPYFHNGGQMTLLQLVDFYNRGGDFPAENQDNLDPNIEPLGLTQTEEEALVAFMIATTDPRVKFQKAPFDHPQLFIANGHPMSPGLIDDGTGRATDTMIEIPAVGKAGSTKPLCTFAENIAGVRADNSGPCP